MKTFRPMNDHILVRPDKMKETTDGGLIIPDASRKDPQKGLVLAVGPGKLNPKTGERCRICVQVGQRVVYSHPGTEVEVSGEKLALLIEDAILAIER